MPKMPMPYVPAAARSGADDFAGAVAARAAQQAVKKEADALARMGANQAAKAAQNDAINVRAAGSMAARQAAKREADRLARVGTNQATRTAQNAEISARQAGNVVAQQVARNANNNFIRPTIIERITKGNTKVEYVPNGTARDGFNDFNALNPSNVVRKNQGTPNELAIGTIKVNGEDTTVIFRLKSKDGRPTMEFQSTKNNGKTKSFREIRYGNP